MNNANRKLFNRIREEKLNYSEFDEAYQRKLKYANNARISKKLYEEGINWFKLGKKLEENTDTIEIDGKTILKRDAIHFQRGYQEGLKQLGFNYGYDEVALSDIPEKYLDNKYFLEEYKRGVNTHQKEREKGNKSR